MYGEPYVGNDSSTWSGIATSVEVVASATCSCSSVALTFCSLISLSYSFKQLYQCNKVSTDTLPGVVS